MFIYILCHLNICTDVYNPGFLSESEIGAKTAESLFCTLPVKASSCTGTRTLRVSVWA
jgi:hypothetical protein